MAIALTDYEQGRPFSGDGAAALAELRQRLEHLQLAQIVHGRRAIVLFEGWSASGRKGALRSLLGCLDPCSFAVHCTDGASLRLGRHWLAPYWSHLPRRGETAIFFESWYSDAVERAATGELADRGWARACDEINEMEAQQTDDGTLIVKLFFHVSAEVQQQRLQQRRQDPWLHAIADRERWSVERRDTEIDFWTDMFRRTDTRWAKWTVIDAGDEQAGQIAALQAVVDALEKGVPAEPPQLSTLIFPSAEPGLAEDVYSSG